MHPINQDLSGRKRKKCSTAPHFIRHLKPAQKSQTFFKKGLTFPSKGDIVYKHSQDTRTQTEYLREWRNRQTRTFEGRVGRLVRVQVPSLAPKALALLQVLFCFALFFKKREAAAQKAQRGENPAFLPGFASPNGLFKLMSEL